MAQCFFSTCSRATVAHDLPGCRKHWNTLPDDLRRAYCSPPGIPDDKFIAKANEALSQKEN